MPKATGERVLEVDGKSVRITSVDKVFFSERGETKGDLVDHYLAVMERLCVQAAPPVTTRDMLRELLDEL